MYTYVMDATKIRCNNVIEGIANFGSVNTIHTLYPLLECFCAGDAAWHALQVMIETQRGGGYTRLPLIR